MEKGFIMILILWATMSLLVMMEYAPVCKDLDLMDKFLAGIIFIIGGPIFAMGNILEAMLDCILPEGWDDNSG